MAATTHLPLGVRPVVNTGQSVRVQMDRIGHMVAFFFRTLAGIPIVLKRYPREFLRLSSDITWGNGSIVVGGGTAGVVLVVAPRPGPWSRSRATTR